MTDVEITPEARLAVVAAFAYAGPVGRNEGEWRRKLNQGAIVAAAAMNGKAARLAQEVLDSDVFRGDYRGYRLEESSQRLIVEIFTDNRGPRQKRDDGVEEIRTDRTDTQMGKMMKDRLDALPLNATILVFKFMEKMSGSSDEVRIMKHFEVLNINKDSASSTHPPAGPASEVGPASTPPEPAGDGASTQRSSPAGKTDPFDEVSLVARIAALPGPRAAALARAARKEGIENIVDKRYAPQVERLLDELEMS